MKQGLVEIITILDRSGSMAGLEKDTIGGYNAFLDQQLKTGAEIKVTTVLFDDKYEVLLIGADPTAAKLTEKEYYTRGATALLDAVGRTINEVGQRLANTDEALRPEKVIVLITTDGYENASVEFNYEQVKNMITHQSDVYKWEFIFFGANIDTQQVAADIGIDEEMAHNFNADSDGIVHMMNLASHIVSDMIVRKEKKTKKKSKV